MKKIAAALAALAIVPAMPALAADLSVPVVVPPPIVAPVMITPASPWTGPYVGLHAGWGFGNETDNQSEDLICGIEDQACVAADTYALRGFIGGIHAGYNWQTNQLVFGIEGELDYSRLHGSTEYDYGNGLTGTLAFRSNWQGSIRARAGVALGNNLIYGDIGYAFARGTITDTPDFPANDIASDTQTHHGLTYGGGIEHMFNDSLSGRIEVQHTRFGAQDYDLGYPEGPLSVGFTETTVTAGFSIHF